MACPPGANAQEDAADLRTQVETLRQGQETILKELADIKKLLQSRPTPVPRPEAKGITLDISGHYVEGDYNAPLTLVEISDYQCPFCGRHTRETLPKIRSELISTGKLRRVFFDLPLESLHKDAFKAAEASRCAQDQQRYLEMQERLFASATALQDWSGHATAVGLDVPTFTRCLESGKHAEDVRRDMAQVARAGIRGTPTFLLASSDPSDPDKVLGVALFSGARPFESLQKEVEQALTTTP